MNTKTNSEISPDQYRREQLAALLPYPKETTNKYSRGHVVIIGGAPAYPGAACLAALAAQRAGAGYVEVFCAPESMQVVRSFQASLVVRSWESLLQETRLGNLLESCKNHPTSFVIGPGFDMQDETCAKLLFTLLDTNCMPLIIDGGALGILASDKAFSLCKKRSFSGCRTILTPHAKELSRLAKILQLDYVIEANTTPTEEKTSVDAACTLAGCLSSEEKTRIEAASVLANKLGASIVAKGPNTFIVDEHKLAPIAVTRGTSALAKAGTGDVLAGIIGALIAQYSCSNKVSILDACVLGTELHALAGCLAEKDLSSISVVPEDVIAYLPQAIKRLEMN